MRAPTLRMVRSTAAFNGSSIVDPEMNPVGAIQPYVDRFLLGEKKEWSEAVLEAAREASLSALALPGEIGRYLTLATRGDLEVRVRPLDEGLRVRLKCGDVERGWIEIVKVHTPYNVF